MLHLMNFFLFVCLFNNNFYLNVLKTEFTFIFLHFNFLIRIRIVLAIAVLFKASPIAKLQPTVGTLEHGLVTLNRYGSGAPNRKSPARHLARAAAYRPRRA